MAGFETTSLPLEPTDVAPDGSDVRSLLATSRGSMAHFTFPPGHVSPAVRHHRVEEIWYVVDGTGLMWRSGPETDETGETGETDETEEIVELAAGCCLTIPVGTSFQVRNDGPTPLIVLGMTMPPWPPDGDGELVDGHWDVEGRRL